MGKTALSTQWRIQRSSIPEIELANLLRVLQNVVGQMDPQTVGVTFDPKASFNDGVNKIIHIDAKHAVKNFPAKDEDVDVLVGLAVHEATHTLARSHGVASGPLTNKFTLENVSILGEEIYVDNYARRYYPRAYQYLKKARDAYNIKRKDINWNDFIEAWLAVGVYGHPVNAEAPVHILQALNIAVGASRKLRETTLPKETRRSIYSNIYTRVLEVLARHEREEQVRRQLSRVRGQTRGDITSTPTPAGQSSTCKDNEVTTGDGQVKSAEKDNQKHANVVPKEVTSKTDDPLQLLRDASMTGEPTSEDENLLPCHGPTKTLDQSILEKVKQHLDAETEDITDAVSGVLDYKLAMRVIWSKGTGRDDEKFDQELYHRLLWLRDLRNTIGKVYDRVQPEGLIDQLRLYRAPIDGMVFKRSRILPQKDLKLVLLLDASSSMTTKISIYDCAKAVYKVIPEAIVLTYSGKEIGFDPNASRPDLYKSTSDPYAAITIHTGKRAPFKEVYPEGETPSGLALLAAAMRFPQSIIIHFTDGASNLGPSPLEALLEIKEKFPQVSVVNILFRPNIKKTVQDYGSEFPIVSIRSIEEFPERLLETVRPWMLR